MNLGKYRLPGLSKVYVAALTLLFLTLVLYRQTVLYLNDIWSEISIGEYAHGYLVLAISVYLVFINRQLLKNLTPCPTYALLPLLFVSVMLWLSAALVDVEVAQTVALLFIILMLAWSVLGHVMIKQLAFPILFISFAIPVWFPLSPILQDITADVVFWLMRVLSLPVYREANFIVVPGGVFSIEEACSGLRYLLAALTLGSLYAYMNYVSLQARAVVVIVAAATAILANFMRVFIVVYLGYATDMQHPWVDDHLMLGWYLFGGLVVILLFLDARYYKHSAVVLNVKTVVGASASDSSCDAGTNRYLVVSILCAAIIAIGPAVVYQQNTQQSSTGLLNIALPESAHGWSVPLIDGDGWQPQYHGAIQMKSVHQVRGEDISLFIAYYPSQKQGVEVINDLNRISDEKFWKHGYAHPREQPLAGKYLNGSNVLEQVIENGQKQKRLVWYWYNIGGQVTINKYEAKVMQLLGVFTGKPQAYMVAISVAMKGSSVEQSNKVLLGVVSDMQKPLADITVAN